MKQLRWVVLGLAWPLMWAPSAARSQTPEDARKAVILSFSQRIDALIVSKWKDNDIHPTPLADPATYYRRINLDIGGRIPELTSIRDFIDDLSQEGDSPERRWKWVEDVLESEAFSRHFANVLRATIIGESNNLQAVGFIPGFENWLREKLKNNVRYDQIVRDLLTSTANANFDGRFGGGQASTAAFFFANENKPENLASATSRVFLGVKLECAQCHAHPFAKWTRNQFWEFAAFFQGMQNQFRVRGGVEVVNVPNKEIMIPGTGKTVKAKFLDGRDPKWKEGENALATLSNWITARDNEFFAKATVDLVWQYFMGVSLLEPLLEPSDDYPVTHPELLDLLANEFIANKYDLKFLIRAIVHTQAYNRSSVATAKSGKHDLQFFARMPVRGLSPEQFFDSLAEATEYKQSFDNNQMMRFNPFNQPSTPRGEFLQKFTNQDKRIETQTSILQALFMMNGKFLAERTKFENSPSLQTLARQESDMLRKVETLYLMVLSRLPRTEEAERALRYIDNGSATRNVGHALSDVYWALLNSGEFMLNH